MIKPWYAGSIRADMGEGKCGSIIFDNEGTGVCGENLEGDIRGEYLSVSAKLCCTEEWQ